MTPNQDVFGRVPRFRVSELEPAQQGLLDSLSAALDGKLPRAIVDDDGRISGAFNFMLLDPEAAGALIELGHALTRQLPERLREIVILETARALDCEYEWQAHESVARRAGVTDDEIRALREGRSAASFSEHERIARDVVSSVLTQRDLSDDLYRAASESLGAAKLWDVVTLAGYYSMMVAGLVAFRAPLLSEREAPV